MCFVGHLQILEQFLLDGVCLFLEIARFKAFIIFARTRGREEIGCLAPTERRVDAVFCYSLFLLLKMPRKCTKKTPM